MNLDCWEEQMKATVAIAAHWAVPVFRPTLTVIKRANADVVRAGELLTYTITVTNTGNLDLHATITDTLPAHVSPGGVLTWTPIITAPGGIWTETVVVTIQHGYVGPLTNVVEVTTEEGATGIYTETSTVLSTPTNQAPYIPTSPIPADGARNVPITQTLSWNGGDPDGDTVTYTIAISASGQSLVVDTTTVTSYTPNLVADTTYYWVVTATDGISTVVGPTWSFTTAVTVLPNQTPYTPTNPVPPDGASGVPIAQTLSWQGGDPDGDLVTYTVSLGTSDPPPFAATTTLTGYMPTLVTNNTYYWVVTATDGVNTVVGPTWSFTTVGFRYVYLPVVMRSH